LYPKLEYKLHSPKTLTTIVEIASDASSVFDKSFYATSQSHESKVRHRSLRSLALKSKTSDKKEATPKHTGFKSKTSDEKRGNLKTQGAQIKDL
jgi:hypothetical protein